MEKIVFLDRDGTINVEKNYLYKIEEFEFIDGAEEAIKLLNDAGYKVVVVSNQAGVARGYYTEQDVDTLHKFVNQELEKKGAQIDAFYYCPHHPEHGVGQYRIKCNCRKPETGLFEQAEKIWQIDKDHSYMIGDNKGDIQAGKNYGVSTILVRTGYGEQILKDDSVQPDYVAENLLQAVQLILNQL